MSEIVVVLNSGRTSQQGVGLEVGKTSPQYFESVSYIELSEGDAGGLGVEAGDRVEISTDYGSVVVSAKVAKGLEAGSAFIPYGLWANQVFGSETGGTGMPVYKGVEASIKKTAEAVPSLVELVGRLKGG